MSDRQALKEAVLREAEAALRQQGFFAFSMRQVARSAGVDPSVVSSIFGGRRGLLKAAEARLDLPV